jgi:hypothetical protein
MNNVEIREARKAIADTLGVKHNAEGTEYYGMRNDSTAWMCVFHKHETCVAEECICDCHKPKIELSVIWV